MEQEQEMRQGLEQLRASAQTAIELLDAGGAAVDWLEAVRQLEAAEKIAHGVKLQALAKADRAKVARAGIGAWLAADLGYSNGRARGLAQEARRLAEVPQLAGKLAAGDFNQDQTRILARTVKAASGTGLAAGEAVAEVLDVLEQRGVSQAQARVRVLEEKLAPGSVRDLTARARARSFLRFGETAEGMVRIDGLLDAQRATVLRAAIDQQVSTCIRVRQYDGIETLPSDVASVEQMAAQALTHLAESYLAAPDQPEAKRFKAPTLYIAPLPTPDQSAPTVPELLLEVPAGCALSIYGELVPADESPSLQDPAASVLTVDPVTGDPVQLDGRALDANPNARLADNDQHTALAYRDRHCTEPGCTRPSIWSLHAHHRIAFKDGGPTVLDNLTLLCPQHHILRHHPDHGLAA